MVLIFDGEHQTGTFIHLICISVNQYQTNLFYGITLSSQTPETDYNRCSSTRQKGLCEYRKRFDDHRWTIVCRIDRHWLVHLPFIQACRQAMH